MCRLFGFRSVIQSQVHKSLVSADNALLEQSKQHPDGWGVSFYVAGAPHVVKSVSTAVNDKLFRHVSGIVSSETVLAHLRRATHGDLSTLNTHPFQYGTWVFAHNGNIARFAELREALTERVPPVLRSYILGETDSEVLFFLLLGHMARRCELHRPGYSLDHLADAARDMVEELASLAGPMAEGDADGPSANYLTFIITNGATMLAHQGGRELHCSTHKHRCSERESCASFRPECETAAATGFVSHLILSSEPLQGENVWTPLRPREMVGVDWRMQLHRYEPYPLGRAAPRASGPDPGLLLS